MACGNNYKTYMIGTFASLGGFLFGYHTGVISGVLIMENFIEKTELNKGDKALYNGIVVGVLIFGCFLGSLIGGQTSDRFSRKYSISAFSLLFTISAAIQTPVINYWLFCFVRFFAGVSIGALSMIIPVYHCEIAETRIRGRIITLQQFAITIGIAASYWLNWGSYIIFTGCEEQWQIPLGFQMIPSFILTIGILFCPFSPRWLVSRDREDEAKDVLTKIRTTTTDEIEEELRRIKDEVAYLRENEIDSYRKLLHSPLRYPFILGVGIQIFQQLTGINSTMYYAPQIFGVFNTNQDSNSSSLNQDETKNALFRTGIYGCVNILLTIPTIFLIDKTGRRILLIAGGDPYWKIVPVYVFVGGFAFSWGPIPWVYCTEIFPLSMRAKATSLTTAINWIINCIVSFSTPTFLTSAEGMFYTFAILCAIMTSAIYFFYPETKNIHLEEISVGETNRIFIPQWFENRRINHNNLPGIERTEQTHTDIANEPNTTVNLNGIDD